MLLKNTIKVLGMVLLLLSAVTFNACDDDDKGEGKNVALQSFGPSPALRGGDLRFIGQNLNKVTKITLPGNVEVSSFEQQSPSLIVIKIPEATAVSGKIILHSPDGDIESKSLLGISEPIAITSISPNPVRPGETVTITGTYLNLVESVIFSNKKTVEDFESQSNTTIELIVPIDAQTGPYVLSNGKEVPILVESDTDLGVIAPAITSLAPLSIRAGSELTITGTNLDLVEDVTFGGNVRVADFVSQSATEIVIQVAEDAKDGAITVRPASQIEITSASSLTLVIPQITSITPNPAKNGQNVTVTGTNLDLISGVEFGGEKMGTIQGGGTATSISVGVPIDAIEGIVKFNTKADKSVSSASALTLVKPVISSFSPASVNTASDPSITITGTNLDLVSEVVFGGGFTATVEPSSATSLTLPVVPGSVTGKITLKTKNGTSVESGSNLTIVPNVPNIPSLPEVITIGRYVTITGTNLTVPGQIILPNDVVVTQIGAKTATSIEFFVPLTVTAGVGRIKFVTNKNEIYLSPETAFKFAGVDPILDPGLMINDFSVVNGHDLGWDNWGGALELLSSSPGPGIEDNGNFIHGTNTLNGWSWLWGCNHAQLSKPSVSKANHVFKMDVYLTKAPPAGAVFKFRFSGTEVDLGNLGAKTTASWVTLTFDLSSFGALPATIPADGEWGLIYNGPDYDMRGFYADNFRFEEK